MNKTTLLLLLIMALILAGCGGSTSDAASQTSKSQSEAGMPAPAGSTGELTTAVQVAIGTLKLDGTGNAVTAGQAAELLPLWQTLQVLYSSDTAAAQEIDALTSQIQDTMTAEQMQAITALNLGRQDMFSIMQSQGAGMGDAQGGTAQRGGTSSGDGGGFGPGGGGFAGGPPPDGSFPGGDPNFRQGNTQSDSSTDSTNRPAALDPNRIPTLLIQAVIEYLQTRAGS